MDVTTTTLVIPTFIAGILTFLAPCTLPLVPGYLGFISGASLDDLKDPEKSEGVRRKVFLNGVLYVIGFSIVFVLIGSLFGLGGAALAKYRVWLARVGGLFVIIFGLYMMKDTRFFNFFTPHRMVLGQFSIFSSFASQLQHNLTAKLNPGEPLSSLIFGASFAFGWSPCVGPILGSVLALAASSTTVGQGALLLTVFSLGLAIPFLLIALGIGSAANYINRISKYLNAVQFIGGIFLVFLGLLLLTNSFAAWLSFFYRTFNFIEADRLLDYL